MDHAPRKMHPAYSKPCIRTIEGEEMCDLLGPVQGYAIGPLPFGPSSPIGSGSTLPKDISNL